jgi:hypothetical protein
MALTQLESYMVNSTGTSFTFANISATGNATITGNVSATYFNGNGSALTGIVSTTAQTVTTAAQPNITSVGTLTNTILGGSNSFTGGNLVSANYITGTLTTAAQPNITSVGTLTGLTVTGATSYGLSSDILLTKTGATGVVVHDITPGAVFYHTSPAANFTANFTNVPTTDGRVWSLTLIISQGATPYGPTALQIEGVGQTIKWFGSATPSGTASKVDIFSFTLIRTGSAWIVLGQSSTNYG